MSVGLQFTSIVYHIYTTYMYLDALFTVVHTVLYIRVDDNHFMTRHTKSTLHIHVLGNQNASFHMK
jgi:hypothetical protein